MLQIRNICKQYKTGDLIQNALDNVSLNLRDNEFVAILGPSGSGKTTLLNIIGGLDRYDSGDLLINSVSTKKYKDRDWDTYRNHSIGFVFQSYNLIPHQTILSNVELALTISGISRKERKLRAKQALTDVGLGEQIHKKPNQMSGGQMQRVAIARALVNNPDILLADEPTGALDSKTSVQIMDILKKVAEKRLVVMVTHNPELAEEYATRIVNLKDGKIISDSNPFTPDTEEKNPQKTKKSKLNLLPALRLSFNNLLTKKGRTFLTSFAGAIGIIGIALILALSNGMNDYISSVESNMMGSYPIELEKTAFDLDSMMSGTDMPDFSESAERENNKIYSNNIVADSVERKQELMKDNDLGKFKLYLEKNKDVIKNKVSAIEYGYDIIPQVYREDKNQGLVKVSPASLSDTRKEDENTSEQKGPAMMFSGSLNTAWSQIVSDKNLRKKQYILLKGNWPTQYNEVALVINENNEISDFTLYTLGLLDISKMNDIIDAVNNNENYEDKTNIFNYSDVIGLSYKVFAPCQFYKKSDDAYADFSKDEDFIIENFENAVNVKITCVLKATENAEISSGIAYTAELTEHLLDITSKSDIVKEQLKNPAINVLTGKEFETEDSKDSDEETTSDKPPKKSTNTSVTAKANKKNLYFDSKPFAVPLNNAPDTDAVSTPSYSENNEIPPTTETTEETTTPTVSPDVPVTFSVKFLNYDGSLLSEEKNYFSGEQIINLPKENPTRPKTAFSEYIFIGWKSSQDNACYQTAELPIVTDNVIYTATYYEYKLTTPVSPDSDFNNGNFGNMGNGSFDNMNGMFPDGMNGQLPPQYQMPEIDYEAYIKEHYGDMINGSSNTNLTDDQLKVLMAQMSDSTPSTYEAVLETLGYYTKNDPTKIALYPLDFESKDVIEQLIADYNSSVKSDSDKVTYTDMISVMTSAVTSIVNTVSYVLVAFVAISLVVSSIMIAIITYISVLERTKEIGVLRALGASKRDVSKIFNAETFIEGLISGIIGIVSTLLLCIPINAIIKELLEVEGIANLPIVYSVILVIISVILTLSAGFFPARLAAKKDPVTALRSE